MIKKTIQRPVKRRTPRPATLTASAFNRLSDDDKAKVYADCETITPATPSKPLAPRQRATWAKAKRKLGRPVIGRGHKVISTSIEAGLLKRADSFAKRRGVTRAALIADALNTIMQRAG